MFVKKTKKNAFQKLNALFSRKKTFQQNQNALQNGMVKNAFYLFPIQNDEQRFLPLC
jgi:hypothetical protein